MPAYFYFLAFLPILTLLVLSIWKGVKAGVLGGFIVTTALFFLWGGPLLTYLASLVSAFAGTVTILMIIFGAVLLYHIMDQKGFINGVQESLAQIHPDRTFRFYFLAIFLTAFFESVAGFGTPGAIVPLLLIAMGFPPVLSVAVVLLLDGIFAMTGAVGTPVTAGLALPLNLSPESVTAVYRYSGLLMGVAGLVLALAIQQMVRQETQPGPDKLIWKMFPVVLLPFALLAGWLQDLTGLLASGLLAVCSYLFLFQQKNLNLKPWLPYSLLVVLLLLPKLIPPFADLLNYKLAFSEVFGTAVSFSFQPLRSPLIPFLAAGGFAMLLVREANINLKPVLSKTGAVFLVLFPSLAVTQLMLNSGSAGMPSMVQAVSEGFKATGPAYPVISPLVGVLGAFISGSTTVSNIIFGPVQYTASQQLSLNPDVILSLQLVGASLGNAVCLFNIIAAAAVAGLSDYSKILKKNLAPVGLAALASALVGFLLLYLYPLS